jgi:hypothetical protein
MCLVPFRLQRVRDNDNGPDSSRCASRTQAERLESRERVRVPIAFAGGGRGAGILPAAQQLRERQSEFNLYNLHNLPRGSLERLSQRRVDFGGRRAVCCFMDGDHTELASSTPFDTALVGQHCSTHFKGERSVCYNQRKRGRGAFQ